MTIGLLVAITAASPAQAKPDAITSISISGTVSKLTIAFDKPITQSQAEAIRAAHSGRAALMSPTTVYCGSSGAFDDSNGTFTFQYYCNGFTRTIPWGFVLSATNQVSVVGLVAEAGLSWWCNGALVGQNSPHTVPPNYLFHGAMNPVAGGCIIQFQDYMTWRHNIGPGGTATLAVAGSLYLAN